MEGIDVFIKAAVGGLACFWLGVLLGKVVVPRVYDMAERIYVKRLRPAFRARRRERRTPRS
ncbi:hypothetical protein ETD86_37430 [Nonomuraea turkmeniaca]|uniref:Uncharacterized protein n=1 Tax=Nonomuraea turkmeniaca TaxID=103838 RepID=A0A5S4F4M7_9ACTN|nr:hypothetical protein [Nonomuraea turkmeniaca]TMR11000.1 hypothetical protein ETD86_37430 [Nonomuraea turkmeniaca]